MASTEITRPKYQRDRPRYASDSPDAERACRRQRAAGERAGRS
jgi:hypothetical protein